MPKYIDADEFAKEICKCPALDEYSANAVIYLLHRQPAANVEEVKYSSWMSIPCRAKYKAAYECRRCGRVITQQKEPCCPSCGAKMDGENQRKQEKL